ncbi:hypothetical protein EMPG_09996 [Blastomyces silverae]|uniref:F-box domain-containing protein n=1 Tax=Blastomyces silverae TaxID=2060906 RepID=A0A0H1B9R7_9EURO|nr:hypothetical protein EMPG_09996 [Blastomyces silverae]
MPPPPPPPTTTTTNLTSLPPEIACLILASLPDFTSLFSAIQSHRFCHDTFTTGTNGLSILRSILQRKCAALETRKYGSVLRDLFDIVRYAVVPKAWARGVFDECWGWFKGRGVEELLIPVGMALAWSIITSSTSIDTSATVQLPGEEELLQKQKQQRGQEQAQSSTRLDEAIALLEDIWKGSAPFGWTNLPVFLGEFPLRDEKVTVPAWPLMYPLAASLVKLYAMLPGTRSCGSDHVHVNNNNNNDNFRSLDRQDILRTLRPQYDTLDVAVIAGIDIYIDTRTYRDGYEDLARSGVQFMNDPRQLWQQGAASGRAGRFGYCARPVGNLFMFWMRVGSRPRFLPRDRLPVR